MRTLSAYQLWYGVDRPPPATRELRAGSMTALLDGIDLRYVRASSLEVVRRIYVAVRDQNWNTIPGRHRVTRLDQQADSFEVEFEVEHRAHDLAFAWHGRIAGSPGGQIRYEMDGVAKTAFRYNRVGLCILHPFRECAGRAYQAHTPQGEVSGRLPELIGPQRFENGYYVPLFPACSSLTIDLAGGLRARLTFEGDLFEMEDQRNWTDASFKTYCTPLSLGFPHQANVDSHIAQSFTVLVEGTPAEQGPEDSNEEPRLVPGQTIGHLPTIGFSLPADGASLTAREIELLRRLKPDHLRVDLHLAAEYAAALDRALDACQALGCALEVALFITEESASALDSLAALLQGRARVARFLVLQEGSQTAHPSETTAPGLAETLEAQAETVRSAQAFSAGRPIIVSPVTLKRRYNPHATVAEAGHSPDELPDAVDPRQMSLFGAAWTVGSTKYLAESGAASLTYYETTGWLGLMERETGSSLPDLFPSAPGMVFPLYHVFADLAEWKDGTLVACRSNKPLSVAALAVESSGSLHLLAVNLAGTGRRVVIGPFTSGRARIRSLDANTAQQAMFEPERFRQGGDQVEMQGGTLVLDMAPYATVRIDL